MIYHMIELFRACKKSLQIYNLFPTIPLFGLWNHVIKPCDIIGCDRSEKCKQVCARFGFAPGPDFEKVAGISSIVEQKQKKLREKVTNFYMVSQFSR